MSGMLSNLDTWLRPILCQARKGAASVQNNILERRFLIHFGKWSLRLIYRNRPVPISRVLFLRNLAHGEDVLFPKLQAVKTTGNTLRNPFLASQLANMEFGTWSLSTSTLNFLERQIQILKPQVVLEFGSGVSTACLTRYMQELHGNSNRVYVFSIEQELRFVKNSVQLLEALQLEKYARIVHSPLREQLIEGIQTTCYDLSGDFLEEFLEGNHPDFVVIDGPAAEPGARFGTLPLVRPFLNPGALFFLDDALRDGELKVAQLWSQLPDVRVQGLYLFGKGLLVGQVGKALDNALSHHQHRLP